MKFDDDRDDRLQTIPCDYSKVAIEKIKNNFQKYYVKAQCK